MRGLRTALGWVAAIVASAACCGPALASVRLCEQPPKLTAGQQDRLFRFGAIVKEQLEISGRNVAIIARSGLELGNVGVRYSHAGLTVKESDHAPWTVRQLYFACDEQRPRIFDQGISAFLLGFDDPSIAYVSVVTVPRQQDRELSDVALDNRIALQLLSNTYSANAYPFATLYQNCNQWVMEMLAAAWGSLPDTGDRRALAQAWLQESGYRPSVFDVAYRPVIWFSAVLPWLHTDDHPADEIERKRFSVSMPASIDDFVEARVPGSTRMEFCQTQDYVLIHRGWDSIPDGCKPGRDDTLISLKN